jgi:hypothetical protein
MDGTLDPKTGREFDRDQMFALAPTGALQGKR